MPTCTANSTVVCTGFPLCYWQKTQDFPGGVGALCVHRPVCQSWNKVSYNTVWSWVMRAIHITHFRSIQIPWFSLCTLAIM